MKQAYTTTTHRQLNDLVIDYVVPDGVLKSMGSHESSMFSPSTDMNAAMKVFGWANLMSIEHVMPEDYWKATRWTALAYVQVTQGETPQLAICMAALKAKGVECEWEAEV